MWHFSLLIILLLASSIFSSSETALMSLNKIKIRHMLEEGMKEANLVHKLISNPNRLLSSILVGNNIVNIAASALATSLAISYFGNIGVTISTIIMTLLVLIFGEITPKTLAAQHSEKVALKVSKVMYMNMIVLTPITKLITLITDFLVRLLGGETEKKSVLITESELKTMINVSHEEGVLEIEEREMIHNVFKFTDAHVKTVMVHRTDVCFVSDVASYDEVIEIFRKEQYSKIPVYKDCADNVVGVLNVKDLIFLEDKSLFDIKKIMKKPYFTYEFKKTIEIFEEMKDNRIPIAIVLDEYGGTAGIVTMEDLVEEIVGDIEDEYGDYEEKFQIIKDGEFMVHGSTKIHVINELIGVNLQSDKFDSIGGLVIDKIGRLPDVGETIEYENIKFIIQDINKNRIGKLKILISY
ncbi:MAG: hemolysin family protein [Anaeromicrobium sp.]|nr:hemolysin family protein [Anaeromicrobium sp.]MCT4593680.1 hemolysin family protein [Anaeromicrobium sp.]